MKKEENLLKFIQNTLNVHLKQLYATSTFIEAV